MTFKKVTTRDGEGTEFTYYVDRDGYVHLPVAGIKEITLNRKQWGMIQRTWGGVSLESLQTYFQQQAAETVINNVYREKLLSPDPNPFHLVSRGVVDGDRVYASLSIKRTVFEAWLLSSKCGNCGEAGERHAAGSCLFHPTKYASAYILLVQKIQEVLDVPPTPEKVIEHYRQSSSTALGHYRRMALKGIFESRSAWRKAKLRGGTNTVFLQTPPRERGGLLRPLGGEVEPSKAYSIDALTVELTPDVLAFVKRVNQVLKGTSIKELRAKANKLPRAYPAYTGRDKVLEPAGRPEIHLTYLPVGRAKKKRKAHE